MIPTLVDEKTGVPLILPKEPRSPFKQLFKRGSDMKFKLGFLTKRHNENTLPSVRPTPEDAKKWAESFSSLMASKYGQSLFKAFLARDFCEENIEFWLAVEEFHKCKPNKLTSKAEKIYNEFIVREAPKEINLDALTRESLVTKIAQPTHQTFDQTQKKIQSVLEADAYARFLKSDLYLELVHPEKYGQIIDISDKSAKN